MLRTEFPPSASAARLKIEESLGCPVETLFDDFDETPLHRPHRAGSYRSIEGNGREIVIKVIRPI